MDTASRPGGRVLLAPQVTPRVCGVVCALLGLAVLAGWLLGTRLAPALPDMEPNTAAMFVLCGAGLVLVRHPSAAARRAVTLAASLILAVALATLVEHAVGRDLGLDGLLFEPPPGSEHPERPSAHTAVAMYGAAVTLLVIRRRAAASLLIGQLPLLITALVVLFAVVGSAFGADHLHGDGMPLQTLLGLVVLTVGLMSADPAVAPARWFVTDTPGAVAARGLVPAMALTPIALGGAVLVGWEHELYGLRTGLAVLVAAIIATFMAVTVRIARLVDVEHDASTAHAGRFASLVHQAPVGIFEAGAHGLFVSVNERWVTIAGLRADAALGTGWASAVHEDDRRRVLAGWARAARSGAELEQSFRFHHADGTVRWVTSTARPVRDAEGAIAGWIGTCLDITGAHEREAELAASEERFRTALDGAPIGMALVATDGRCLRVNRALCEMTGHGEADLLSSRLQDITHPEDRDSDAGLLAEVLAGEREAYTVEKRCHRADGETIWVLLSVALVRDGDGDPQHLVAQIQDVSERKRHERDLEHLADHDPLTGLFNRRRLAYELDREIARAERTGAAAALLMIDLDNFKEINDSLGHKAGDEVIQAVADALRNRVRATDVAARLGGDEFAVLLVGADAKDAETAALSIMREIRRTGVTLPDARQLQITASTGVAPLHPGAGQTGEDLLVAADIAMYDAKEAGRDRVAVHDARDADTGRAAARLGWCQRIRRALDEDLFLLHYQPIADVRSGNVDRYEALIRLADEPGTDPVAPNVFLPIADRYGLMPAIDRWVVAAAIRMLADPLVPAHVSLEVNLSARSLAEEPLLALIERETAVRDVDPARLIFEITETTAVAGLEAAQLFARRLTRLGCSFALDDFGTGFSSMHAIKHLPYRYVKIDGDFIRSISTSPVDQLMVSALVDIAAGMDKRTIAEYVGDLETYELLNTLGVDFAQGYFVGRPEPLIDALATGADFSRRLARR